MYVLRYMYVCISYCLNFFSGKIKNWKLEISCLFLVRSLFQAPRAEVREERKRGGGVKKGGIGERERERRGKSGRHEVFEKMITGSSSFSLSLPNPPFFHAAPSFSFLSRLGSRSLEQAILYVKPGSH